MLRSKLMSAVTPPAKRAKPNGNAAAKAKHKLRKYKSVPVDPTSAEGVLRRNILDVWPDAKPNDMNAFVNRDRSLPWPGHTALENLEITAIAANGSGLGRDPRTGRVVLVPFSYPGDIVNVHIYRTEEFYVEAEIDLVLEDSPDRDETLVHCEYFGKCAGCQYQHTRYDKQLALKRQVIVNAFRYFAPTLTIPEIGETVESPLQYDYRTKLTPHFDMPKHRKPSDAETVPIGFGQKGRKEVLDIEDCVIGTRLLNRGLEEERSRVRKHFAEFKRGATLLLREAENKELVTDPRQVMRERVGPFVFEYKAGEFFQNNNSILPVVTKYVGDALVYDGEHPQFLVDTYCGCGLFAITCSKTAERVIGVEISAQNVEFARTNATLNNISNAEFVVGNAEHIFAKVQQHDPLKSAVVIDPPRKGCDELFLDQLLAFGPRTVIYVSCNVNSQARDLEYFVSKSEGKYVVESLRGFDFFPQTYHVEGVAVLRRV